MPILKNPIIIKYEGLDADKHEIELSSFAESVKGLEKIISVAANFAISQRYVKRRDAMVIRVMATTPSEGSFDFPLILGWASQNSIASNTVGGLIVALVCYIFSKLSGRKQEMKALQAALEAAIKELGNKNQSVVDRLLDTVDSMAASLRPAAQQALTPIGNSVYSLSVLSKDQKVAPFVVGEAEKEAVLSGGNIEILDEAEYKVRFHEMNKDTNSCRISFLDGDGDRITAVINDPCFTLEENNYIKAFANNAYIPVKAKAAIRDGEIIKLFINNS
ncbi:hypothetical protein [uncultured Bartonella sp.]|uniref:DUF7946 domain-containing protein n=1 Tax=uncultured Bartonella sp. TaxID=104108 RepID=UPI0025F9C221|nr:hypothetical protein [uncultured Bartonella sp.]